jgi:hypothetical protein
MGWTPIHAAAQERLPGECRALADAGANPQLFTKYGFTPFLLARPLDQKDPERRTAAVIRLAVVGFLARLVMTECAKLVFKSEQLRRKRAAESQRKTALHAKQGKDEFPLPC